MKQIDKLLLGIAFVFLFFSCQKDPVEKETQILLSVNVNSQKFNKVFREAYMAAYTPEGELLSYGCLSDSSTWDLKAEYDKDKIDILYFEIQQKLFLSIHHIKNVDIGQLFEDDNTVTISPSFQYLNITLKVEDFANHINNNTSLNFFGKIPYIYHRGNNNIGEFDWQKIEDSYAYKSSFINIDTRYQGSELLLFERGTNLPYICYMDISADDHSDGDTILINKSDFNPGQLKTIQVNSSGNENASVFLYTYNTVEGKEDLITSFDHLTPGSSVDNYLNYVISDILPVNYWTLKYYTFISGLTSYTIYSSKEIPALLNIEELSGQKITGSENNFEFTHSNIFQDRNLARSTVQFTKGNVNDFTYSLYFDASETTGSTSIVPFEIPVEILEKFPDLLEINNFSWNKNTYSQIYTDIPDNSPLEFLRNSILNGIENNTSGHDFAYEMFTIDL